MARFSILARSSLAGSLVSLASLASANLLQNGGFEGPGLPSWLNFGVSANALLNVYNNSGANGFFLPSAYGNFVGVTAHDGAQFVAGGDSNSGSGFISQQLQTALTPGEAYTVSAWLQRSSRPDLNNPATYQILLCPSNSSTAGYVVVGEFAPNAPFAQGWVNRKLTFIAPPTAGALPAVYFVSKRDIGQGFAYSALDNVSLNLAGTATLNGTIVLSDFVGATENETVDIAVRSSGNTVLANYNDVPLAADGSYSLSVTAFNDCRIFVRGRTWIRRSSAVVSFTPNENLSLNFSLTNGDADQSGEVDAADIDLVISAFGGVLGQPGYSANADLDGSTEVDAADIDIAIANFGGTDE